MSLWSLSRSRLAKPYAKDLQDQVKMQEKLSIGAGKPFPPLLPDSGEYIVEFESIDDPMYPQNWSLSKKYGTIMKNAAIVWSRT